MAGEVQSVIAAAGAAAAALRDDGREHRQRGRRQTARAAKHGVTFRRIAAGRWWRAGQSTRRPDVESRSPAAGILHARCTPLRRLAAALLLAGCAPLAAAWGPQGHRTVGAIADRLLIPPRAPRWLQLLERRPRQVRQPFRTHDARVGVGVGGRDPRHARRRSRAGTTTTYRCAARRRDDTLLPRGQCNSAQLERLIGVLADTRARAARAQRSAEVGGAPGRRTSTSRCTPPTMPITAATTCRSRSPGCARAAARACTAPGTMSW